MYFFVHFSQTKNIVSILIVVFNGCFGKLTKIPVLLLLPFLFLTESPFLRQTLSCSFFSLIRTYSIDTKTFFNRIDCWFDCLFSFRSVQYHSSIVQQKVCLHWAKFQLNIQRNVIFYQETFHQTKLKYQQKNRRL